MDRTGIIALLLCALAYIGLEMYFSKVYPHKAPVAAALAATNVPAAQPPAVSNSTPVISSKPVSETTPATATIARRRSWTSWKMIRSR